MRNRVILGLLGVLLLVQGWQMWVVRDLRHQVQALQAAHRGAAGESTASLRRQSPPQLAVVFTDSEAQIPAPPGVSAAQTRLLCVTADGRELVPLWPLPAASQTLPGVIRVPLAPWITEGRCQFYGYGAGTMYGWFPIQLREGY